MVVGDRLNRFSAGGGIPTDYLVKMDSTSIDATATAQGNDVDIWEDLSTNGFDATQTGTPSPELDLNGSTRQVYFDQTDYLTFGATVSANELDFVPGTDEFTFVIRLGDLNPEAASGWIISKAGATASARQYGFLWVSGAPFFVMYAGGDEFEGTGGSLAANDLIFYTMSTSTVSIQVNGTVEESEAFTGTTTNSDEVLIGSRTGPSTEYGGNFDLLYIYDRVLTAGEITEFRNAFEKN